MNRSATKPRSACKPWVIPHIEGVLGEVLWAVVYKGYDTVLERLP
ncbi:MAG: hypothetical protein R3F37_11165 [Candidatus Competibacteraceae bacterium]